MAIKIIPKPDLHLTEEELARFRQDYYGDYAHWHHDPLPSFESYCRRRKEYERTGK